MAVIQCVPQVIFENDLFRSTAYCSMVYWFLSFFLFEIGEIFTKGPLDREAKAVHELQIEVKDQGSPARSAKTTVRVMVTDVNDNAPVIVEPEETVLSVREELPAGTEVVRIRAVDTDEGNNASITYSFVIGNIDFPVFLFFQKSSLLNV